MLFNNNISKVHLFDGYKKKLKESEEKRKKLENNESFEYYKDGNLKYKG